MAEAVDAILDLGDLTVSISDAGDNPELLRALTVADAQDAEPGFARCRLVVAPNQRFVVRYAWNGIRRTGSKRGAGIFAEVFIDGYSVERSFLPLRPGRGGANLEREWEIAGKFFYDGAGNSMHLPFQFGERPHSEQGDLRAEAGLIRVVLQWARVDPELDNPHPPLLERYAIDTASQLRTATGAGGPTRCVDLAAAEPTDVIENDMRLAMVDDLSYTFVFEYDSPGESFK